MIYFHFYEIFFPSPSPFWGKIWGFNIKLLYDACMCVCEKPWNLSDEILNEDFFLYCDEDRFDNIKDKS